LLKIVMLACALSVGALCGFLGVVNPAAKNPQYEDAAAQTKKVKQAATAFLNTLSAEQRQEVAFDFTPKKTAVIAPFHRTSDGGVAPGGPTASAGMKGPAGRPPENPPGRSQHMGPPNDGKPGALGGGPGGSGFGMGPPGGFIGEQYGKAVWSNYPVSDVLRPGLQLGSLNVAQRAAVMDLLQTVLSPMGIRKSSISWDPIKPCLRQDNISAQALPVTRWASSVNRAKRNRGWSSLVAIISASIL
jgi:hypothetical protein